MTTPINPLPVPPSPADSPVDFNTNAFALLGALPAFVTQANAQASGLDAAVAAAELEADAAALKAGEALTSANNAALSKTGADSARDAAVIAQNAAEAALDSFDDRYLGAKASAPATDNDGGALLTGALYWDTVLPGMRSWNGTEWVTLPAATKASVGLANVDNTSDAAKSVLSATKLTTARTINGVSFDGSANISINAAAISNTPAGSISATNVQAALNELDAEKFGRNTILGTVSQSAGVPTGALIEYGSNANGEYCRYADGTQICWSSKSVSGLSFTAGTGVRYASIPNLTFPSTFSLNPTVHYAASNSDVATLSAYVAGYSVSTTGIASGLLAAPGGTTGTGAAATIIKMVALGRWY